MRCSICIINQYDFICIDCNRIVCGDCSIDVIDTIEHAIEENYKVRVCKECLEKGSTHEPQEINHHDFIVRWRI